MHVTLRETDARPMPHGLSERVRLLQREHLLSRGIALSTDDALAELDRIDGGKPSLTPYRREFPVPRHLELAASMMAGWGYTNAQIDSALTHLNREGTATCCMWIEPQHRDVIETTLPMASDWQSSEWDEGVWAASTDREFAEDGFEINPRTRELACSGTRLGSAW